MHNILNFQLSPIFSLSSLPYLSCVSHISLLWGQLDPIKIQNKMGTKVKGLLKGIKSFSSQIFDEKEEEEPEIQIGGPTDVKHLSHIGCDGPGIESPTWMKGFDASQDSQSGRLDKTEPMAETPEVKWVSEDSSNRKGRRNGSNHRSTRSVETAPLLPRSSKNHRRRSMDNNTLQSDSSTKTRHTRKHQPEGRRRSHDQKSGDDATNKSSRRKPKSKEETGETKSTADESDHGSDTV